MVDHSGNELYSPHVEFDFDPTLLDEFLFRNMDRVLARVVELGAKMTTTNETISPMNTANEEENPLINMEEILTHIHASTSNARKDNLVGHRIPFIKVPRKIKTGHEKVEEPPQYEEEEPLGEEITIQQQISSLSQQLALLTSHVQKESYKNVQKSRPKVEISELHRENHGEDNTNYHRVYIITSPTKEQLLTREVQYMKATLASLHERNVGSIRKYQYEELCPYPFDKAMTLQPFPKKFDMPKFDKYKGKGDQRDHVKYFYMAC